ncbi:MAG: aminotransferase class V-fold PLP-dependent enzyme, partial [Cetobacterium sp.]
VRGSGTGAIKWGFYSILSEKENRKVLVHKAAVYPTTKVTFEMMGVKTVEADFNNSEELKKILKNNTFDAALIQYTRQKIDDSYIIGDIINEIKKYEIPILTDDNYAVMKVSKIGSELGADISAFSTFKLLGPEGIGCVVGKKEYIEKIVKSNYSGGGQVQGHEALDVLRGLIYAPVSLAIQGEVNDKLNLIFNSGEIEFIKNAYLVNAQSKVIVVELKEDIAEEILIEAEKLGALPNPVGAESKYEFSPLFYRVSGTFRATDSTLEKRMIRINPNRAGVETIVRILKESYKMVKGDK